MVKKFRKTKVGKAVDIVVKYVLNPLILVIIFLTFAVHILTPNNKVPSFFGLGVVRVVSGSMVERGFNIGDVVFVNTINTDNLSVGDNIIFYCVIDDYDKEKYEFDNENQGLLVNINEFEGDFAQEITLNTTRITANEARMKNTMVYFHFIQDIFVSPDGIIFYQTTGSNPTSSPDGFIRQDLVLGKYMHTPKIIKSTFNVLGSFLGLGIFIFLPFAIFVAYEGYSFFKAIRIYFLEKKLFDRQISYKDPIIKKLEVVKMMSLPRKAYFWLTSEAFERKQVFALLYAVDEKSNAKIIKQRDLALEATQIFEQRGVLEFFKFWYKNSKNPLIKKQFLFFKNEYEQKMLSNLKKQ